MHSKAHKRCHYGFFFINSPRTNGHQLACHHHHSRCVHQAPTQAQTTNPTSHLNALLAIILDTLYCTVEYTCRGSSHRIYCRSVPESRHPSHSVIDIIIDCFSVNHELPAFIFNILIILLVYLFKYFINLLFLAHSVISLTLHVREI